MKYSINDMNELASNRGGQCLSTEYRGYQTPLDWRCGCGFEWSAPPVRILHGHWCPRCGGCAKGTIEEMREIALDRRGQCLSKKYVNARTPLKWQCEHGHQWKATPSNVKRGTWCPRCRGKGAKIEDMRLLAEERGGRCLSRTYERSNQPLQWECSEGHSWEATPAAVKHGGWCPRCSQGLSERICRTVLEAVFESEFPKKKPRWLVNSRGNRMELDGYAADLGIAFEHNGEHHYKVSRFSASPAKLRQRREDDEQKKVLCRRHGITLVEIPQLIGRVKERTVKRYILDCCNKAGVKIPPRARRIPVDLSGAYDPGKLRELREIAASKGGDCLSRAYLGSTTKLRWRCGKGHEWLAPPISIKTGRWCSECAGNARKSLDDLLEIASELGGRLLSTKYFGANRKLEWECKEGHRWKSKPAHVRSGHWCPHCAKCAPDTIDTMHEIARKRGGRCLSKRYKNQHSILRWRCEHGHEWRARAADVKAGAWCHVCGGTRKKTIADMRRLAAKHGGVCLSKIYVNCETPLRWRCAEGHEFEARPNNVHTGHWCRVCSTKKRAAARAHTIDYMHVVAGRRNGKCLSAAYVNQKTKLEWECPQGHRWMATPKNIIKGRWCPVCARKRQRRST